MNALLFQIEKGLDANLYYLSLFASLSIPDVCAALESENGRTDKFKYKKWLEEYLVAAKPDIYGERLSSDHIYDFRCALFHQGRTVQDNCDYQRILFFEPGQVTGIKVSQCCIVGANTKDRSLLIDVKQFCADIVAGANKWHKKNKATKTYFKNYEKLIKRYPTGISPVLGLPIIG